MKRSTALVLLLVVAGTAGVVLAGTIYKLTCSNDACNYKGEANFGGGRMFAMATGWCTTCREFTGISWKRSDKKPAPAATIWDSKTGKTLELHACPKCKKPFLPIESIEDLTHCPKCAKDGLKNVRTIMYD